MGNGTWTRWGRGSCEGYSLNIGDALRGSVSRRLDGRWAATLSQMDLGQHETKEVAMAAVEWRIDHQVRLIRDDWAIWEGQAKGKSSL